MFDAISEQPGRLLAVFVFAPLILYKGIMYSDWFLIAFAILLFAWDMYWLAFKPAATYAKAQAANSNRDSIL